MVRAFLYGVRTGLKDVARMPLLAVALFVTVGLATFLALLSPLLGEAVDVGGTSIIEGSEVIIYLDTEMDANEAALVSEELGVLAGVAHVRLATSDDIASTLRGYEVGSDISHVRTVVLDGTVPQTDVINRLRQVPGAVTVDAGVGDRTGLTVELLRTVVPWLTALFGLAGLVLVVAVAVAAARSRRDEAEIMRLLGANWFTVWANLGVVVLAPVLASMLVTTVIVALVSSGLIGMVGSTEEAHGAAIVGEGLRLTTAAAILTVGASQLGFLSVRR